MSEPSAATTSVVNEADHWPASWKVLPHGIATGRYTDPAFARLEFERLWSRVWQPAARLDEVPEVGDYCVYEICDQSVLIVRVTATAIKAYFNVCPHRGTALGVESGKFPHERIICPFHGWRWDLQGNNHFVLEREEFRDGQLRDSDVALKPVQVEVYAGFIFINLSPSPESFADFIAPVRALLEDLNVEHMHHYWWKSVDIAANWKVAQEAFFEGYHVPATHPQLEPAAADFIFNADQRANPEFNHWNIDYENFAHGHGRFFGKKTPIKGHVKAPTSGDMVDAMAARLNLLVEGMDAQVLAEDIEILRTLKGKSIPADSTLGGEYVKALYARAAEQQRPMPKANAETISMWGGEIFIFPNLLLLPQAGNCMMYRVRPHHADPDKCVFEIFSTKSYPAAVKPPRAIVQKVEDPLQELLLIPQQDLGNIPRMQKGLHSLGIRHIWLASHHEKMILNMHRELDEYLKKQQSL